MIFGQRDNQWYDVPVGFGLGTIGEVGCVVTSVAMCLYDRGYTNINPEIVNTELKVANGFAGTPANLVNWSRLNAAFLQIEYIDSYNYNTVPAPIDKLKEHLEQGYSVIIKINGLAIGGRGDHFVKAERVEGDNVIVKDPWYAKEDLITSLFTLNWADTATEIITGFRVMKITPAQGGDLVQENEMIIKKDTFADLSQSDEKWKDICSRFGTDPNNTTGLNLFTRYDQAKKAEAECKKSYVKLEKAKKEVDGLLKAASTVADDRKKLYDDLVEYLAMNLGTSADIPTIKGSFEGLLDVEDSLGTANRTIEKMEKAHDEEKKELKAQIESLREDVKEWKNEAEGFEEKLNILEDKITTQQEEEGKTNLFKKLIDDLFAFFTRKKVERSEQELQEDKNEN